MEQHFINSRLMSILLMLKGLSTQGSLRRDQQDPQLSRQTTELSAPASYHLASGLQLARVPLCIPASQHSQFPFDGS